MTIADSSGVDDPYSESAKKIALIFFFFANFL